MKFFSASQMMILTDDMDLAGDIIQPIMEDFSIEVREKHVKGIKEHKECEGVSKLINNCPSFFLAGFTYRGKVSQTYMYGRSKRDSGSSECVKS